MGQGPRGATPRLRPGVAPKARVSGWDEQLHARGAVAVPAQEGLEEPSHVVGPKGQQKEIPLIQGKDQWLFSDGAAEKRYPMPKVRETQVRW